MLIKQKSSSFSRNLTHMTFSPEVLSSVANKAKLIAENLSKNSSPGDSVIYLPGFLSRTNLKLHIFLTHRLLIKVITNLDSTKVYGHDCMPVVVLKNWT